MDEQLEGSLGFQQRLNVTRINDVTDGVVNQIRNNPQANEAYENIRERTLQTMNKMAKLTDDRPKTREEVEKLLVAGVDFLIGQLENQLRQVRFTVYCSQTVT